MANRILVIRGGAIGDFIATLPALGLLRSGFPTAHIEVLGYRHIAEIANGRFYANAVRCIEYGPLSGFFNPVADLDPSLCEYFASFDQVISYLFDPDQIFERNLTRAGARNVIVGTPRMGDHAPAAIQLAQPLQRLALFLEDSEAIFYPSKTDLAAARALLPSDRSSSLVVSLHPGSGGERKNWPIDQWVALIDHLLKDSAIRLVVIGGEADRSQIDVLRHSRPGAPITYCIDVALPTVGALLALSDAFIGHDSGISHLAAATDCPALLLFGPTDPAVWAPQNENVRVLASKSRAMADIQLESVVSAVDSLLRDVRNPTSANPGS